MYKNILLRLGFVEITEINPIKFRECLTEYWEGRFSYSRFNKIEGDSYIELIVGNHKVVTDVKGIYILNNKKYTFQFTVPMKYLEQQLLMYLHNIKSYLSIEYNTDTSTHYPQFRVKI